MAFKKQDQPSKLQQRINHYRPSTIREEAEQHYLTYKEHGYTKQKPKVLLKKTLKAVLLVIILVLMLAILTILSNMV